MHMMKAARYLLMLLLTLLAFAPLSTHAAAPAKITSAQHYYSTDPKR